MGIAITGSPPAPPDREQAFWGTTREVGAIGAEEKDAAIFELSYEME
jgi:hypothetical protein